ncbi:hypothetical protein FHS21_002822 [Phyllobacterium trifolii]|uniref:Uncharacterized protein n=1 Tax=Phyllobacterium trifolii TaxID=300193 RepID=A0A839U7C2_9HYPH|nr:hypothetical protein [Phyllobacterium trifolii]MBB3146407.1 hypothetical protein [Phyllobacterium trifolii]
MSVKTWITITIAEAAIDLVKLGKTGKKSAYLWPVTTASALAQRSVHGLANRSRYGMGELGMQPGSI